MGRNQVNAFMIDYDDYIPNFFQGAIFYGIVNYKKVGFRYGEISVINSKSGPEKLDFPIFLVSSIPAYNPCDLLLLSSHCPS